MTPKVVFMGTPAAALPTLETLAERGLAALVVTQPDRPRGRSGRPQPSPVKTSAIERGLLVAQPVTSGELIDTLADRGPFDVGVVVAYGRILSPQVLDAPIHGFLNVHFSLLPRWKGAAPVEHALMAGDPMTGVTIMRLDEGVDTGPILTAQGVDIGSEENAGELTGRLADLGARLLFHALGHYLDGTLAPVRQSEVGVTIAPKIEASDRPLDLAGGRAPAIRRVRALAPHPGSTLDIDGVRHKILSARAHSHAAPEGTWTSVGGIPVAGFGDGGVELVLLQPPGKNAMSGADWLRGRHADHGQVA